MRHEQKVETELMARYLPVWLATMEMANIRLVYICFPRVQSSWWVVRSTRRKCGDLLVTINRQRRTDMRCRYYPRDPYALYEVAMEQLRQLGANRTSP